MYLHTFSTEDKIISIAAGYGLEDWAVEVGSPAKAKVVFPVACVQTGCGTHSAFCGYRETKVRDAVHSAPSSA
jgi:hypothetical protein